MGSTGSGIFSELQSHYLFADHFGRPGKGNDKGKVEGLVGYARRNFMVPIPQRGRLRRAQRAVAGVLPAPVSNRPSIALHQAIETAPWSSQCPWCV
jgi:transposase